MRRSPERAASYRNVTKVCNMTRVFSCLTLVAALAAPAVAKAQSVKTTAFPTPLKPDATQFACTVLTVSSVAHELDEVVHHVWATKDGLSDVGRAVSIAIRRANGRVTALRIDGFPRPSFAFTAMNGKDGAFLAGDEKVINATKVDEFADVATSVTPSRTLVLSLKSGVGIVTEFVGETAWTYTMQCR